MNKRDFLRFLRVFFLVIASFSLAIVLPKTAAAVGTNINLSQTTNFSIRIDGAAANDQLGFNAASFGAKAYTDINGDGKPELIVGTAFTDFGGQVDSGSIYIINGELLESLTGPGDTIDLADSSNYSLRIDGDSVNGYLGSSAGVQFADINNDNLEDMIISGSYSDSLRGNVFILFNDMYKNYIDTTGNVIDLSNSSSYNIILQGAATGDSFGNLSIKVADLDNDSKNDILLEAHHADNNSRGESGSVFVFFNTLLDNYTGTGNILNVGTTSNFSVRFDGALASHTLGGGATTLGDYNDDGLLDYFISSDLTDYNSRGDSGSIWIFDHSVVAELANTSGNIIDLAGTTRWVVRIDGATAGDLLSYADGMLVADVTQDGKDDIVVGSYQSDYNSRPNSGSLWIIDNAKFGSLTGTGTLIDLATNTNYRVRLDGASSSDNFTFAAMAVTDVNNNGKLDILAGARMADTNGADSGAVYVFLDSLIDTWTTAGATKDLASAANYSVRYDGAAGQRLYFQNGYFADFNLDGQPDFIFSARGASYNSRSASGSYYFIYNFPHTISTSGAINSQSTSHTISGTVSAPTSVTSIAGVEYSLDSNSTSATWTSCTASDGTFDSTSETYSCSLTDLTQAKHTVYIRAIDSNGFYTAQSSYAHVAVTTDHTGPTSPRLRPTGYTNLRFPTFIANTVTDLVGTPSYTFELDSDTYHSYSVGGLPSSCGITERCIERDDLLHTVTYQNEHDSNTSNNEIGVFYKNLLIQPLTEGVHHWKVTARDETGNSNTQEATLTIDLTPPEIYELTVPGFSQVQTDTLYPISEQQLSLIGLISDRKMGSVITYADGAQDRFAADAAGSSEMQILLSKKSTNGSYETIAQSSPELLQAQEDADKKIFRFATKLPNILERGIYRLQLTSKDGAGNESNVSNYYFAQGQGITKPIQMNSLGKFPIGGYVLGDTAAASESAKTAADTEPTPTTLTPAVTNPSESITPTPEKLKEESQKDSNQNWIYLLFALGGFLGIVLLIRLVRT